MNVNDFMRYVLGFLPKAQIEEDSEGQLIIYTNLQAIPHPTIAAGEPAFDPSETLVVDMDSGEPFPVATH